MMIESKTIFAALSAACLVTSAAPAVAAGPAKYLDNRSTAVTLVRSLYNAVNRHEYLRAWGYFAEGAGQGSFETFAKGYETTKKVRVKLGKPIEEGAAGSIYTKLPVVIQATDNNGRKTVFSGCYETRFVQPANQATPPFTPLQIVEAKLEPATTPFKKTQGNCPQGGLG
ncbi:hypothetical protein [Aurantimonas sp. VKM B-3413]|uniref:hypothetical protein n=1 Tax=Aurantimonas sp. VKM B-3413 TaxID=2779401 RepID=UPI001E4CCF2A|nr:hypothetical protein [Aurantimonas sp. VKM B-3413]MCB8840605.1 hypothetical protein [Aurantimonas sp. VKM B-3413]